MRRRKATAGPGLSVIFMSVLFLTASLPLRAQTPQPTPALAPASDGLTFEQIYDLAEHNNLQVNTVRRRRAVAEAAILIAGERPNPNFISPYTRSEPRWQPSVSQLIELGGKRGRRIDVARNELHLTELDLDAALRTLRHDVRAAYFNISLARNTVALGQQAFDQAKQLADIARERFEAGDVAQFEVLQANLAVDRATNDLLRLENAEQIARATMNQLLNRAPDAPLDLRDTLFVRTPPISTSDLIGRSLSQNVELRTAEQQITTEQSRLRLAQAQRVPDLMLEPGIETFDSSHPNPGFKMQVTVPLPIFNRGRAEIRRSSAMLEQLQAERDATRHRVSSDIGRAALNLESARKQVEFYETKLLPEAERVRQLANEAYRIGQTNLLSVIDATRNAREVRQAYLQALFDYQSALADLEQAAGVKF
ncbi:MAG TPA: TolC family protein [Pyrinomonadaceae bacterium]|nr:TolC family protein [Pyrinomonadaceae bacterium]